MISLRIILVLNLLISSSSVFSQNYQTINSSQINYFGTANLDYILATRTDSIAMNGTDSVFYSFKTVRIDSIPNFPDVYGRHAGAPWYGRNVVIESNGRNTFFNRYNEAIHFETQANIGDTFEVYVYPTSGDTIFGTVSLHDTLTILGSVDSVKQITLFSSDPTFILDGEHFILSKNHGFIKCFPFYSFPEIYPKAHFEYLSEHISAPLTLVGTEFPRVGITKLTNAELYSMDIGDQINIKQSHSCFFPTQSGTVTINRTLMDKQNVGANSVEFQMANTTTSSVYHPNGGCWSPSYAPTFVVDNFDQYTDPFLPEELYVDASNSYIIYFNVLNESLHCGKQLVGKHINTGFYWLPDDVIGHAIETAVGIKLYLEGFGSAYTSGNFFNGSSYWSTYGSIYQFTLGTLQCGDISLGVEEQDKPQCTISPNPTNGLLRVTSAELIDEIEIIDLTGNVVFETKVNSFDTQLQLNDLTSGVYLVKVISGSEITTKRMIMK